MDRVRASTRRFLRNTFLQCHLHVQGDEARHAEFVRDVAAPVAAEFGYTLVDHNLRTFPVKDPEKPWSLEVFRSFDFGGVADLRGLAACLDQWREENPRGKVLFLMRNAEEFGEFSQKFVQHLFSVVHHRLHFVKLITVGHMSWPLIAASKIKYPLAGGVSRTVVLPNFTMNELVEHCRERGIVKNAKEGGLLLNTFKPYLPKNMSPIFLQKPPTAQPELADHVYDFVPDPHVQSDFQTMPSQSSLCLMAAYFASYNPKDTDERFFGEKSTEKRTKRELTRVRPNLHELGARPFTLDRLQHLYDRLFRFLIVVDEVGRLDVKKQIAYLLHLGYVERASDVHNLQCPKFRCTATLDSVEQIAAFFVEKFTQKTGTKADRFHMKDFLLDFAIERQAK
ncbi:Origin recognition complex subunit 5 [Aphelenchoides fujianensis]|nr:Origin recognition complex subunit 5 [Aphelenchoides fujianensis]